MSRDGGCCPPAFVLRLTNPPEVISRCVISVHQLQSLLRQVLVRSAVCVSRGHAAAQRPHVPPTCLPKCGSVATTTSVAANNIRETVDSMSSATHASETLLSLLSRANERTLWWGVRELRTVHSSFSLSPFVLAAFTLHVHQLSVCQKSAYCGIRIERATKVHFVMTIISQGTPHRRSYVSAVMMSSILHGSHSLLFVKTSSKYS